MPTVTFSGQGPQSRNEYISEAEQHGWTTWGKPAANVDVTVVGEEASARRIATARRLGIVVIDYERWAEVMLTGEL